MSHLKDIKISDKAPRKIGVVESDARDKSRKVSIGFLVKHPKYGKYIRKRTIIQVHDQDNISKKGDRVEIAECRPISKTKSWVLTRVVNAAPEAIDIHKTTIEGAGGEVIGSEVEAAAGASSEDSKE